MARHAKQALGWQIPAIATWLALGFLFSGTAALGFLAGALGGQGHWRPSSAWAF